MARSSEEDYDELLDEHDHGEASDSEEHAYEDDDILDEAEDGDAAGSRASKSRRIQKKEGKVKRFFKCHCNRVISATSTADQNSYIEMNAMGADPKFAQTIRSIRSQERIKNVSALAVSTHINRIALQATIKNG